MLECQYQNFITDCKIFIDIINNNLFWFTIYMSEQHKTWTNNKNMENPFFITNLRLDKANDISQKIYLHNRNFIIPLLC